MKDRRELKVNKEESQERTYFVNKSLLDSHGAQGVEKVH